MGFTGVVFGVVAAVWLVYLIPLFLNRRDSGLLDEVEPGEPFSTQVTVVRRSTPMQSAEESLAVVSTPLNRRAALRELAKIDAVAAQRRRRVLGFLLAALLTVTGVVLLEMLRWWWLAVPVALIVGFLVIARISVRTMRRGLARRAKSIRGGAEVDEPTVILGLTDLPADDAERKVELSGPVESTGSLWDPLPIPAPTYVSRPITGRTVRTIDLSGPPPAQGRMPITAELPEDMAAEVGAEGDERPAAG
ncbi:MAG: hypothetical protein ACK5LN_01335 [Propioniciclava sp.]